MGCFAKGHQLGPGPALSHPAHAPAKHEQVTSQPGAAQLCLV